MGGRQRHRGHGGGEVAAELVHQLLGDFDLAVEKAERGTDHGRERLEALGEEAEHLLPVGTDLLRVAEGAALAAGLQPSRKRRMVSSVRPRPLR